MPCYREHKIREFGNVPESEKQEGVRPQNTAETDKHGPGECGGGSCLYTVRIAPGPALRPGCILKTAPYSLHCSLATNACDFLPKPFAVLFEEPLNYVHSWN